MRSLAACVSLTSDTDTDTGDRVIKELSSGVNSQLPFQNATKGGKRGENKHLR